MIATTAAPLAYQYGVLAAILIALALVALIWRGGGAIVVMALCAGAAAWLMSRFVSAENTVAPYQGLSPYTGPILAGALLGLFLHVKLGKRRA